MAGIIIRNYIIVCLEIEKMRNTGLPGLLLYIPKYIDTTIPIKLTDDEKVKVMCIVLFVVLFHLNNGDAIRVDVMLL